MQVQREQLSKGVCVRLLSDWSRVPAGTTSVIGETLTNQGYCLTVSWDNYYTKSEAKLKLSGIASHSDALDDEAEPRFL